MSATDLPPWRKVAAARCGGGGRQFPEPGEAWQRRGPGDSYAAMAAAFGTLIGHGRHVMPDVERSPKS